MYIVRLRDAFYDVNDVQLSNHAMNVGPGWSIGGGNFSIKNNCAVFNSGMFIAADAGTPDGILSAKISDPEIGGIGNGLAFRVSDGQNGWYFRWNIDGLYLYEVNAGVQIPHGNLPLAPPGPHRLQVLLDGPTIIGYLGKHSIKIHDASFNQGVTAHGLMGNNPAITYDDLIMYSWHQ